MVDPRKRMNHLNKIAQETTSALTNMSLQVDEDGRMGASKSPVVKIKML